MIIMIFVTALIFLMPAKRAFILILILLNIKFMLNQKRVISSILVLEALRIINFFVFLYFLTFERGTVYVTLITVIVIEAIMAMGLIVFLSRNKKIEILSIH